MGARHKPKDWICERHGIDSMFAVTYLPGVYGPYKKEYRVCRECKNERRRKKNPKEFRAPNHDTSVSADVKEASLAFLIRRV